MVLFGVALIFLSCNAGDSVAKFASVNVHKRLVAADAYREKRYEEALKRAFLRTDQDFLASQSYTHFPVDFIYLSLQQPLMPPILKAV